MVVNDIPYSATRPRQGRKTLGAFGASSTTTVAPTKPEGCSLYPLVGACCAGLQDELQSVFWKTRPRAGWTYHASYGPLQVLIHDPYDLGWFARCLRGTCQNTDRSSYTHTCVYIWYIYIYTHIGSRGLFQSAFDAGCCNSRFPKWVEHGGLYFCAIPWSFFLLQAPLLH